MCFSVMSSAHLLCDIIIPSMNGLSQYKLFDIIWVYLTSCNGKDIFLNVDMV